MTTRSRIPIVVAVLAGLGLSAVARNFAATSRARGAMQTGQSPAAAIGRFDSYTLALLLGGLRGPLVMMLWTSSETQKTERNLADFDTKVEWIRLLQPEFDSVHIFQIWNKAYNISVQMTSLSNKYLTIIDALKYARDVDSERPDNINILVAEAQILFDKLGGSNEKAYYRKRVRDESFQPAAGAKPRHNGLDPVIDASGMLLPKYVDKTRNIPAAPESVSPVVNDPSDNLDGSELQFLKPFQPFKQGVSPLALGYNYYKRAQVLQDTGRQRHLQLSDMVVDSRPALSLKGWSEEEWERARRFECAAFGINAPAGAERLSLEMPTAQITPETKPASPADIDNAIFCYETAVKTGEASLKEYNRHLSNRNYALGHSTYDSHIDNLLAEDATCAADLQYLKAIKATDPQERKTLLADARLKYREATDRFGLIVAKYYVEESLAPHLYPQGTARLALKYDPSRPGMLTQMAIQGAAIMAQNPNADSYGEDRGEYMTYITRNIHRLEKIDAVLGPLPTPPGANPSSAPTSPSSRKDAAPLGGSSAGVHRRNVPESAELAAVASAGIGGRP